MSRIKEVFRHQDVEFGDYLIQKQDTDGEVTSFVVLDKANGSLPARTILGDIVSHILSRNNPAKQVTYRIVRYESPLKQRVIKEVIIKNG